MLRPGATSLNSSARISTCGSQRVGAELQVQPVDGARGLQRDAVGVTGHAHARFGLEIEERLDARGIAEVDRPACHQVAAALERHLAALHVGASRRAAGGRSVPRSCRSARAVRRMLLLRTWSVEGASMLDVVAQRQCRGRIAAGRRGRRGRAREVQDAAAGVEGRRVDGVAHVHLAAERRAGRRAAQRQGRIDQRPHALGEPQAHLLALHGDVDLPHPVALDADRAAELHRSATEARAQIVQPDGAGIEMDRAEDVLERVRQPEVADAAALGRHRADERRLPHAALERRLQRGAPGGADVRDEALEDAEVRVPLHPHRHLLVAQVGGPRELERRVFARQPDVHEPERVATQREAERRRVSQAIVEQPHVQRLDGGVDDQPIHVSQRTHDANRAAGDGGRERRQPRLERAHVGIQRGVGDAERDVGVPARRQLDASGAGHGKSRRRGLELQRHHVRR